MSERVLPFENSTIRRIVRFTTAERIRVYTGLMAAITLGGGVLQLTLGHGLIDWFGNAIGADFVAFYTGARFLLEDRLSDLYDLGAQLEFQRQLIGMEFRDGHHPFVSPPYALFLYVGFGAWSYPVGLALWWISGLGALWFSAAILRRELPVLQRTSSRALFGASFLFFPTIAWLLYGQASSFILLIYTSTYVLLRRQKDFAAGACLGCLAFKPQLALTLALVLIFKWRWKALLGGGLVALLWLGAGFILSPAAMMEYWALAPSLPGFLRAPGYPSWGIHSVFGFSLLLLDGFSLGAADTLTSTLSVALLLALAWRWRGTPWETGCPGWDHAIAGTLALGLILSPHLFVYDLTLLLLPFAIVYNHHARDLEGRALDGGPILAWTALLWIISYLGSYLSLGQLALCELLGLPAMALQLSTPIIAIWAFTVLCRPPRSDSN